ncbi:hypothetical protein [Rhizobium leguminosarum]|uniref:hypothetical protein n=1 Tax=Rhizobium leguminosarum TaxID=384 RepID=UPI001FDFB88D|nr:hypothetical protein [Rhizobium leguminosarum]
MKNAFIYLILAATTFPLSSCTTTSESSRQQFLSTTARSGVRTLIAKNWHIDDDCRHIDYPAMNIVA